MLYLCLLSLSLFSGQHIFGRIFSVESIFSVIIVYLGFRNGCSKKRVTKIEIKSLNKYWKNFARKKDPITNVGHLT